MVCASGYTGVRPLDGILSGCTGGAQRISTASAAIAQRITGGTGIGPRAVVLGTARRAAGGASSCAEKTGLVALRTRSDRSILVVAIGTGGLADISRGIEEVASVTQRTV